MKIIRIHIILKTNTTNTTGLKKQNVSENWFIFAKKKKINFVNNVLYLSMVNINLLQKS